MKYPAGLAIWKTSLVREGRLSIGPADGSAVDTPDKAARLFRAFIGAGADKEHFVALALDARGYALGVYVVTIGTVATSLVHPREVFKPAILASAASVIVCHNHPSGDPSPSAEDREATRRLKSAGDVLGIQLADHIIIGDAERFYSFRDSSGVF